MDDLLGSLRVNQSDGGYFAAHDRDVGFRPSGAKSFERNPLHLIEGDPVVTLVVEPGDPREFMAGHLLGDLELTAVLKVGGDPGCSEAWALILVCSCAARARCWIIMCTLGCARGMRSVSRPAAHFTRFYRNCPAPSLGGNRRFDPAVPTIKPITYNCSVSASRYSSPWLRRQAWPTQACPSRRSLRCRGARGAESRCSCPPRSRAEPRRHEGPCPA